MSKPTGYYDAWSASNRDVKIMSFCIKMGYLVYPHIDVYQKHWPLVRLAYTYRNEKPLYSKKRPFPQKYLAYEIHQLYNLLYERKIKPAFEAKKKLPPAPPKKVMTFPAPPPIKMAPPPPPKP